MKIVVTGALGHIGSALIRQIPYQFQNAEIVLIDNMLTQRFCSLFSLPKEGAYRLIDGDIRNLNLEEIFSRIAVRPDGDGNLPSSSAKYPSTMSSRASSSDSPRERR